ncbi:PREDICTED: uncharacterized protein PFB0145c-like isoform X2 [Nicrophorus vespilloides]|uniref:Uncharacterized protein PFB0145c-like isoform X2 n=1 Tax=Nicrophorus vespilloides TaxID=110193 RepID=A0ABM1N9M7_NICVS|nr:PREDICTED: uncharacterized protein PFB0145c-like isoform X2 [Nicrophorus vespilloides]
MVPKNENSTKMGIYQDTAELQNRELQRLAILNKYEAYIMKIIAQNQISIINRTYPDNRLSTKFLEYIQSITQFLINYNQTIYEKCSKFPYSSSLMEFLELYVALEHDSMIKLMKDRRSVEQRVLELLHKMFRHRPKVQKYIVLSVVVNAKNEHGLTRSFCLEFITKTEKEMLWANRNNNLTIGRALLSKVWINPHLKMLTQEYDSSYEDSDLEMDLTIKEERNKFRRKRRKLERPQKQQPNSSNKVHLDTMSASIKKEIVSVPKIERRSWPELSATGVDLEDVKNVQIKSELSFSETVIKHERNDEDDSSSSVDRADSFNNRRNASDERTLGNNNGHFTNSKEDGGHSGGGGHENHSTNIGLNCSNLKRDTEIAVPSECTKHSDSSENSVKSMFKELMDDLKANAHKRNTTESESSNQSKTKAIIHPNAELQSSGPSMKSELSVEQSDNVESHAADTNLPESSNKNPDVPIQIIVKIALLPEDLENNVKAIDNPSHLETSNVRIIPEIVADRNFQEESNERKHNLKILEPSIQNQNSELPIQVIVKAVSHPEVKAISNEKLKENKLTLEIDILENSRRNNEDNKLQEVSNEKINLEIPSSEMIAEDRTDKISSPAHATTSQQNASTEEANETANEERILEDANPDVGQRLRDIPQIRCEDTSVLPVNQDQERTGLKCLDVDSEIALDISLDTAVSVDDRKFNESVTKLTKVKAHESTTEVEVETVQELDSKNVSVEMFEETLNENESLKILTTNSNDDVFTPSESTQNIEEQNSNINDGELSLEETAVEDDDTLKLIERLEEHSGESKQSKLDVEVINSDVLKEVDMDDSKLNGNELMEELENIEKQQAANIEETCSNINENQCEEISNNELIEEIDKSSFIFNEDNKQTEELKESMETTENSENISENVIECSMKNFDKELIEENEHLDNSAEVTFDGIDTKCNVSIQNESSAEIIDDSFDCNLVDEEAIKSNEVIEEIINQESFKEISEDKVGEICDDHLPLVVSEVNIDSKVNDIIEERNLDIVMQSENSDVDKQIHENTSMELFVPINDTRECNHLTENIKDDEHTIVLQEGESNKNHNEMIEPLVETFEKHNELFDVEMLVTTEQQSVELEVNKKDIELKERDQIQVKEMDEMEDKNGLKVKEIEEVEVKENYEIVRKELDQAEVKHLNKIVVREKDELEVKAKEVEFKENYEIELKEKDQVEVQEMDEIEDKDKNELEVKEIEEVEVKENYEIELKEMNQVEVKPINKIVVREKGELEVKAKEVEFKENYEIDLKEKDQIEVQEIDEIEDKDKNELEVKEIEEVEVKENYEIELKEMNQVEVKPVNKIVVREKGELEVKAKEVENYEIDLKEKNQVEVQVMDEIELKEKNQVEVKYKEVEFKEKVEIDLKEKNSVEVKEKAVEFKQKDEIDLKEKYQVNFKDMDEIIVKENDEVMLMEKDGAEVQEKDEVEENKMENQSSLQDKEEEHPDDKDKLVIEEFVESVDHTSVNISTEYFEQENMLDQSHVQNTVVEQNILVAETLNVIEKSNNEGETKTSAQFIDEKYQLEDSTITDKCITDICETSSIDNNLMSSEFVNFEEEIAVEVEIECEEVVHEEVIHEDVVHEEVLDFPEEIQQTSEEILTEKVINKEVENPKDDIKKLDESKSEYLAEKDDFNPEVYQNQDMMPELTKEEDSGNNIEHLVKKMRHRLDDNWVRSDSTETQIISNKNQSRSSTEDNLMPELKKEIKIDNKRRDRKKRKDDFVVNNTEKVESPKVSTENQIFESKNETINTNEDSMRKLRNDRKSDKKKYEKKSSQIAIESLDFRNKFNGRKSTPKEDEQHLMPTLVKELDVEKEVSIEKNLDKSRQHIENKVSPKVKDDSVPKVPKEAKLDFRPDFEKQSNSPKKSQDTIKLPKELQKSFEHIKIYAQRYCGSKKSVPNIEHILKSENLFSGVQRKTQIFEASKTEENHPIVRNIDIIKDVDKTIVDKPVIKNDELNYKSLVDTTKRTDERKSLDNSRHRREKSLESKSNSKSSHESDNKSKKYSSSSSSKRKHDSKTKDIDESKSTKRVRSESSSHSENSTKLVDEKQKRHSRSVSSEKSTSNVKELEKMKRDKSRQVESSQKSVDKESDKREKESSRSLKRKSSSDLKSVESKSRKTSSSESKRTSKDRDTISAISLNSSSCKSKDSESFSNETATSTTVKTIVVKSKDEMEKTQHENINQFNSIFEKGKKNIDENTESKSKKRNRCESSSYSDLPDEKNKRYSRSRSLEKSSSKSRELEKTNKDKRKRDERTESKRKSVDKEVEKLAKSSPRSLKKKSSSSELKPNEVKTSNYKLTSKDNVAVTSLTTDSDTAKKLVKEECGKSIGLKIPQNEKISYVDQYLIRQREIQNKEKYDKLEDCHTFSEKVWHNEERYSKTDSPKSTQLDATLEVKSEVIFRSRSRSIEIDHLKDARCEEIESDSGISCLTTTKSMGTIAEISEDELNMLEVSPNVPQIDDVKEEPICESTEKQTEDNLNSIAVAEDACGFLGIKVEETESSESPEKDCIKSTEDMGKGLETLKSFTESLLESLGRTNASAPVVKRELDKDQMSSSAVTQPLSFAFQTYAEFIGDDEEDDIKSQRNRKLLGDLSLGDSLKCDNPSQSQVFDYEPKLYGFGSLPCVKDSLVYDTDFMQVKVPEDITESQKTVDSLKIIENISMNFAPGKESEEEEEDGSREGDGKEQEDDEDAEEGEQENDRDEVSLDHTYIKPKLEIEEIPEMVISSDLQIGDTIILDEDRRDNSSLGVCFNPTRDYSFVEQIVNVPSVEHLLSENQFSTSEIVNEFCEDVFEGGLELKNISPMKPIEHRLKTPEKSIKVEPTVTLPLPRYKRTKVKAPPKKSPNS